MSPRELQFLNISQKEYSIDEINTYLDSFISFPITDKNISFFPFCYKPKISIIIPVYNNQNYILNLHKSIQDQSLEDIEIIYVDDCSTDNSIRIIENLQKKDQRIVLLKNKENKGPFYSRNKGAIFANGEYIQFIDSDDLIVGDILIKAYIEAKAKILDIVQYKIIERHNNKNKIINEITKGDIIRQPELSDQMFYGKGFLQRDNYYILNKIIKRDTFLKSLMFFGDDILKQNLYINEDIIQLFSLLRVTHSLLFINHIGYIKFNRDENKLLLRNIRRNPSYANRIFHDNFIELKFLFDRTKNDKHDKAICLDYLKTFLIQYGPITRHITKGYELFDNVFDSLLNYDYFDEDQKAQLDEFKNRIIINS